MTLQTARAQAILTRMTRLFNIEVGKAAPFYPKVCSVVNSNKRLENYSFLGNMPGMREWLGDRQYNDLRAAEFEITNRNWESSLRLERWDVDDDVYGLFPDTMREFAAEAAYHPDELLFEEMIGLAESTNCFDGTPFFGNSHSWGDSGTQDNLLSHTVASVTVTDGVSAITSAEIRAAVHKMIVAMYGFKRDNGKYFRRPQVGPLGNLLLVVPLCMQEAAHKAFDQQVLATGEDNFYLERPQIAVCQGMGAGATNGSNVRIDLYHTGGRLKPYIFQRRAPLRLQSAGYNDIEDKDLKWMAEARYAVGPGAWWEAVRCTFSV